MIRLEDVSRGFQVGEEQVHALSHVDLRIQAGEFVAIMGPSGSGKSTLLNILGLLDRPSGGRYLLAGKDVTALNDSEAARLRRERIGFVFQFFHLVHRLTAAANVGLPLMLAGMEAGERRQRVDDLLKGVGLLRDLNRQGATLIVITHDPEVGGLAPRRIAMEDGRVIADTRAENTPAHATP